MGKVKRVNMLETANEFLEKNQRRLRLNGKAIKKSKIKSAFEVITNDEQEEKKFLKQSKENKYNEGINNKYIDKMVDSVQIREDLIERLKAVSSKNINHYIYCQYIKFLNKEGIENIHNKEKELTKYALKKLETVKDIEIYGPKDCEKMLSVISFNIKDKRPEDVGSILDQKYDIMLRAGLHCAPTAHSVIGIKERGTLRIGLGYFNEKEDIDKLVEALNNL